VKLEEQHLQQQRLQEHFEVICRARLTEGEVSMARNYALEPAEVAAGFILTCQSRPVTPAVTVSFDT
jgi:hypothetical protein